MSVKNKLFSYFLYGISTTVLFSSCNPENQNSNSTDEVQLLINKMSLEEKVGQMTQVTIDMILKDNSTSEIDEEKLQHAIVGKNVGSILNTKGHAYSILEWHQILTKIQDVATKSTPNGIPVIYGIDAIHGTTYTLESTLFPHNLGMAATRNPSLVKQGAKITAMETRASGIRWNFDPTLGIGRQPLWSRFEETYGEDVHLVSTMATAAITGYEDDGLKNVTAVASCMKHYLGYSTPLSGKDRTPVYIPETQLREYYLPPFAAAVKAGTSTVMINSGEINGVPVHASTYYLQTILRDELKFKGLAVSDWEDIIRLHTRHRIADSPKEAVKIAVNAGIDMSMVPLDYSFYDLLLELVKEGEVSEARIDEAVYRILKLKFDLGLFDNAYPEEKAAENFGKEEYKQTALSAAEESITLLKNNNNVLPLEKGSKILLVGPAANNVTSLHSAWSYTWQGNNDQYYPTSTLTIKEAIENKIGKDNVLCNSTRNFDDEVNTDINFLKNKAAQVDYIVLALGEHAYAEGPGGIHDLTLDTKQLALAEAASSLDKPIIFLFAQGRPRIINSIEKIADGILMLYRPGSQGANAATNILFGDYNPNGKLPFTYPRYTGNFQTYDHKTTETISEFTPNTYGNEGYDVQWSFGHGLSYTQFSYSNLSIDKTVLKGSETLDISVTVTNIGTIVGKEAVELYITDLYASVTPNVKRLRKFTKISLAPDENQKVHFTIDKTDLSFINQSNERITEPGEFVISIEKLSTDFNYEK